jgi:hypothetical protein
MDYNLFVYIGIVTLEKPRDLSTLWAAIFLVQIKGCNYLLDRPQ